MATKRKTTRKANKKAPAARTRQAEFPKTTPVYTPGGRVDPDEKAPRREELNCCRIKGYLWGDVKAKGFAVGNSATGQIRAAADCHSSASGGVDSGSDSGAAIGTIKEKDCIVHIVTYTIQWRFDDWCKSIKVVGDAVGDVVWHQDNLPPEGSATLTTTTEYPDLNARNVGALSVRLVAVDQTGDSLTLTASLPAPPIV